MSEEPFDWDPVCWPQEDKTPPSWPLRGEDPLKLRRDFAPGLSRLISRAGAAVRDGVISVLTATITFGPLLLLPLGLATLVAMYWSLPRSVWSAWPLFALFAAPMAAVVIVHVIGRPLLPPATPGFERSAAQWLLARVRLLPASGISVAELERGNKQSFYHPASRTIVLEDTVRDERTPRAYAIAAHELGHALLHRALPRLAALQLWCRGVHKRVFRAGMLALLGVALTGARAGEPVALAMIAVAVAMQCLVVLDEASASALALRELTAISSRAARAQMRRMLGLALATYAARAVGVALPLLLWPALDSLLASGLLLPGAPLTGGCLAFTQVLAGVALAALAGSAFLYVVPRRGLLDVLPWIAVGLGFLAVPLLVGLAAPTPAALASCWAIFLALWPAYGPYAAPVVITASLGLWRLPDLSLPAAPGIPRSGSREGIRRLTREFFALESKAKRERRQVSPTTLLFFALAAPLAVIALRM